MELSAKIHSLAQDYNLNDTQEISKIGQIFSDKNILDILNSAEKIRKTRVTIYFIVVIIATLLLALYTGSGAMEMGDELNGTRPSTYLDGIFLSFFHIIVFTLILRWTLRKNVEGSLKQVVIERLLQTFIPDAKYSVGNSTTLSSDFGDLIHAGFLSHYEDIDRIEDSIQFNYRKDGKQIEVQGLELETSEMQGHGEKRKRVTTNHCYLLRGSFPETKFQIDKKIHIKRDIADSQIINGIIFIVLTGIVGMFLFMDYTRDDGTTFTLFGNNQIIGGLLSLMLGFLLWKGVRYLINRNRVKLENRDFEKHFDVVCEDQIVSRMVLNPALMDRLVTFVEKNRGSYEFLFQGKTLYIKKEIQGNYMEVNGWKNITKNIEMFLEWYIELKEIVTLVTDTGVLVFAKTDYTSTGISSEVGSISPLGIVGFTSDRKI